jgi:hypothetical protein
MSERHRFLIAGYIRRRRMCPVNVILLLSDVWGTKTSINMPTQLCVIFNRCLSDIKKKERSNRAHAPHVPGYAKSMSWQTSELHHSIFMMNQICFTFIIKWWYTMRYIWRIHVSFILSFICIGLIISAVMYEWCSEGVSFICKAL